MQMAGPSVKEVALAMSVWTQPRAMKNKIELQVSGDGLMDKWLEVAGASVPGTPGAS